VTRGLIRIRKLLAAAIDSAMYASIKRECVSSIPANEKSHAPSTDRLRGDRDGPPG
jgi:hypothetical protein